MNRLNMIGVQSGDWTVIEPVGNKWRVRCKCGREFVRRAHDIRVSKRCKSCSKRGERAPSWKGGRHKTSSGYVLLTNPENYLGRLRRVSKNTFVAFEHHVVMSRYLGRPLYDNETVHHKNGVRDDNRQENLELWVVPQPKGIRVGDAVTWARMILERYECYV